MSTKEKVKTNSNGVANGKETKEVKEKKDPKFKKRSIADLKKSEKGKIILVAQNAVILANQNDRKDLGLSEKQNTEKFLRSRVYRACREGNAISKMDENSADYTQLLKLTKASHAELVDSKYGPNTVALLKHIINNVSAVSKGFSADVLKDISF